MKTLKNVGTEMALHVLAYNMKRVISILGVGGLMEAIRAWFAPSLLTSTANVNLRVFTQPGPTTDIEAQGNRVIPAATNS
jgi:hypothetical protein